MNKVLYITNIEVPYRVRFFNQLAKKCELTVLYEGRSSEERNREWAKSEKTDHRIKYLRSRMDIAALLRESFSDYDAVIVGCFNSPVQTLAILIMRLFRKSYIINLDGETFLEGNSLKNRLKRFVLSGADQYLVAGEKSAESIKQIAGKKPVIPYYFSSLTEEELKKHREAVNCNSRSDYILVVGQYFGYKGMDVVLEAARMDRTLRYKFVGMGSRTDQFLQEHDIPSNVEVIPFLQKEDLEHEYKNCAVLVLPSRQECWGLVINEAASFGTPIVSTWGSGAAVEFLEDEYPQFLAQADNAENLLQRIYRVLLIADKNEYAKYLLNKSKDYSIEISVERYLQVIKMIEGVESCTL